MPICSGYLLSMNSENPFSYFIFCFSSIPLFFFIKFFFFRAFFISSNNFSLSSSQIDLFLWKIFLFLRLIFYMLLESRMCSTFFIQPSTVCSLLYFCFWLWSFLYRYWSWKKFKAELSISWKLGRLFCVWILVWHFLRRLFLLIYRKFSLFSWFCRSFCKSKVVFLINCRLKLGAVSE